MKEKIKNINPQKLVAIIVLLIIAAAIPLTVYVSQKQQETRQRAAGPMPTPGHRKTIVYDPKTFNKQLQRFFQRIPLSSSDQKAKNSIIAKLGGNSRTVFRNSDVWIEYWKNPDDFEVTIFTPEITLAKKEAEGWLSIQGLSKAGICNLPLLYSLSDKARDSLPDGAVFDTNPLSCQ